MNDRDAAGISLRDEVRPADRETVRAMVAGTGFFRPDEVEIAVELVDEALTKGADKSGYEFLFAEDGTQTIGYACYGPIGCTLGSFDLYWIVVAADQQRRGIGSRLLAASEAAVARRGGRRLYIETSSQPRYEPTRGFYLRAGYQLEATLPDFYDDGDDKLVYGKNVRQ